MLMRDRLLGAYTVRPALERLKRTMLSMGCTLAASSLLLALIPPVQLDADLLPGDGGSSTAAAGLQDEEEYWRRVQEYEPWALQDGDDDAGQPTSVLEHMRSPSQ
jgi:hypothetical protein